MVVSGIEHGGVKPTLIFRSNLGKRLKIREFLRVCGRLFHRRRRGLRLLCFDAVIEKRPKGIIPNIVSPPVFCGSMA